MLTLDQKIYQQSRDLVESNPLVFSAKLYDLAFRNARGGVVTTPPPGRSCYEKWPGRARVKSIEISIILHIFYIYCTYRKVA